jgi:acetylornithine aminotransferase
MIRPTAALAADFRWGRRQESRHGRPRSGGLFFFSGFSGKAAGRPEVQFMAGEHLMPTYARQPVAFVRGEGAWLFDDEGRRYLDAVSGIAVCNLGHAHPAITRVVAEQAALLLHTSNLYRVPLQEQAADALCAASGMDRVFFCNSGAEANEAAIKLARLYGHGKGVELPTVIVMEGAFHGRTLATLTATGNRKVQAGFEPLVQGFVRVPYNDVDAVCQVARSNPNVVAVLVEPVQGEGGIVVPAADYLAQLRRVCDEHGWLLMLDEIQTGNGRTGSYFACQQDGVQPDVITTAKGLGNGIPVGACLARGKAAAIFAPGNHGSTFGGNPLACAAALAVVNELTAGGVMARVPLLSQRIAGGLREVLAGCAGVQEVRARGLLIGVALDRPCGELVARARDNGLLINVTAERVIRLLPPLVMTDADADLLVAKLSALVREYLAEPAVA